MIKIERVNHAIKIELLCPKCGKHGVLFLSQRTNGRKYLRVYHRRGDCLVAVTKLGELVNRTPLNASYDKL